MTQRATLRLAAPDAATARTLAEALAVEAADGPEGASASVRAEGMEVAVELSAPDLSTLRAALHGMVRLFDAAIRSLGTARF